MLTFNPHDPFPIIEPGVYSYADAQDHSAKVDAWLGLETEKVEHWLCENSATGEKRDRRQELWVGLPVRSLLTPYTEIRSILEDVYLHSGSTVVDLGAGYGRMAFVIGRHYRDVHFIGYEYVAERVAESNRCLEKMAFKNVRVEQADLSHPNFQPISADYYFMYDFGTKEAILKTLEDLRIISQSRAITVIGRGRSSRNAIERNHPWLSQVVPPMHTEQYSIYRSAISV